MRYIVFTYPGEHANAFPSFDAAIRHVAEMLPPIADRHGGVLHQPMQAAIDGTSVTEASIAVAAMREPFKSRFANPHGLTHVLIQREDVARLAERESRSEGNPPRHIP